MCIQNIIVITQIFEIFCCSCLFILVIQLFVACNAFSDDWLISVRIHWSVTLKSRIIIVTLGQSFKLSFFHIYYSRHSVYRQSPLYWIGNRYLSAFHIINIPQLYCWNWINYYCCYFPRTCDYIVITLLESSFIRFMYLYTLYIR